MFVAWGLLTADFAAAQGPKITLADGRFGKALDARRGPAVLDGSARVGRSPLTVECWVKLLGKKGVNVVLANDPAPSSSHWRVYTEAGTGVAGAG